MERVTSGAQTPETTDYRGCIGGNILSCLFSKQQAVDQRAGVIFSVSASLHCAWRRRVWKSENVCCVAGTFRWRQAPEHSMPTLSDINLEVQPRELVRGGSLICLLCLCWLCSCLHCFVIRFCFVCFCLFCFVLFVNLLACPFVCFVLFRVVDVS